MNFDELAKVLVYYFKLDEDIEEVYFKLNRPPPTEKNKIDFFKQLPIGFVRCRLDKMLGNVRVCHECIFYSCIFDECIVKKDFGCVRPRPQM